MISANTIEERMLVLEERKLRETSAFIVQQERHSSRLTRSELLELLGVQDVS